MAIATAKQNEGWLCFASKREECTKVRVGGNQHAIFSRCTGKNNLIWCSLKTIPSYVHSVIAGLR